MSLHAGGEELPNLTPEPPWDLMRPEQTEVERLRRERDEARTQSARKEIERGLAKARAEQAEERLGGAVRLLERTIQYCEITEAWMEQVHLDMEESGWKLQEGPVEEDTEERYSKGTSLIE